MTVGVRAEVSFVARSGSKVSGLARGEIDTRRRLATGEGAPAGGAACAHRRRSRESCLRPPPQSVGCCSPCTEASWAATGLRRRSLALARATEEGVLHRTGKSPRNSEQPLRARTRTRNAPTMQESIPVCTIPRLYSTLKYTTTYMDASKAASPSIGTDTTRQPLKAPGPYDCTEAGGLA